MKTMMKTPAKLPLITKKVKIVLTRCETAEHLLTQGLQVSSKTIVSIPLKPEVFNEIKPSNGKETVVKLEAEDDDILIEEEARLENEIADDPGVNSPEELVTNSDNSNIFPGDESETEIKQELDPLAICETDFAEATNVEDEMPPTESPNMSDNDEELTSDCNTDRDPSSPTATKKCIHCDKVYLRSLTLHAINCPIICAKQPVRGCKFCAKVQHESRSYLHEVICSKNPDRKQTKRGSDFSCPRCKAVVGSYDGLRRHLAKTCLGLLVKMTKQSEQKGRDDFKNQQNSKTTKQSHPLIAKIKPKKTGVSKKRFSKVRANKFKCRFCSKLLTNAKYHLMACKEFGKVEPMWKCKNCPVELKLRECLLHEAECLTKKVSWTGFVCGNCGVKFEGAFKGNKLKMMYHFAGCDPFLKVQVKKVLRKGRQQLQQPEINPPTMTDNGEQPGSLDQSPSLDEPEDAEKCPVQGCNASVPIGDFLKIHVLQNCKHFRGFEEKRECTWCSDIRPKSGSFFHETRCLHNPKCQDDKQKSIFRCAQCQHAFNSSSALAIHLGKACLKDHLETIIADVNKKTPVKRPEPPLLRMKKSDRQSEIPIPKPCIGGLGRYVVKSCQLCGEEHKILKNAQELNLGCHIMYCKPLKDLEPHRKCPWCLKSLPKTLSYLHESRCDENPKLSADKIRKVFRCGVCNQTLKTYDSLANHLGTRCLKDYSKHLDEILYVMLKNKEKEKCNNNLAANHNIDKPPKKDEDNDIKFVIENVRTIEREPEVLDQAPSGGSAVSCPFCLMAFQSMNELKSSHLLLCNGIKRFEPKQDCQHCHQSLPFSLSGLYKMVCEQSPLRMPLTANNLQHCDIFCPECKTVIKAKDMPDHLAKCMKHLEPILDNALKNKALNWNQPENNDYIKTAGLDYWLKQN